MTSIERVLTSLIYFKDDFSEPEINEIFWLRSKIAVNG